MSRPKRNFSPIPARETHSFPAFRTADVCGSTGRNSLRRYFPTGPTCPRQRQHIGQHTRDARPTHVRPEGTPAVQQPRAPAGRLQVEPLSLRERA